MVIVKCEMRRALYVKMSIGWPIPSPWSNSPAAGVQMYKRCYYFSNNKNKNGDKKTKRKCTLFCVGLCFNSTDWPNKQTNVPANKRFLLRCKQNITIFLLARSAKIKQSTLLFGLNSSGLVCVHFYTVRCAVIGARLSQQP